jgi:tRNA U34 5-methylaminomethyl-2-thiouridine-forming methyltransferase MnmC
MKDQQTIQAVPTADGSLTLRHPILGECYHSQQGALFEAQSLYISSSGFIERLAQAGEEVSVLDVGLGLGYNAATTIAAWWQSPAPPSLRLVSLELDAELFALLRQGQGSWQENWSQEWLGWMTDFRHEGEDCWRMQLNRAGSSLRWEVYIGAAEKRIEEISPGKGWDYVWQDAFSPRHALNLWSVEWFSALAKGAAPGVRLMTYSVSRLVRENLSAAGWCWEKLAAPGKKRHWLRATR